MDGSDLRVMDESEMEAVGMDVQRGRVYSMRGQRRVPAIRILKREEGVPSP